MLQNRALQSVHCHMLSKLVCVVYIMVDTSSMLLASWLRTLKKYSNLSLKASTLLGESLRSCPSVKCLQTMICQLIRQQDIPFKTVSRGVSPAQNTDGRGCLLS